MLLCDVSRKFLVIRYFVLIRNEVLYFNPFLPQGESPHHICKEAGICTGLRKVLRELIFNPRHTRAARVTSLSVSPCLTSRMSNLMPLNIVEPPNNERFGQPIFLIIWKFYLLRGTNVLKSVQMVHLKNFIMRGFSLLGEFIIGGFTVATFIYGAIVHSRC